MFKLRTEVRAACAILVGIIESYRLIFLKCPQHYRSLGRYLPSCGVPALVEPVRSGCHPGFLLHESGREVMSPERGTLS
jgi:hypothetical protein